MCPAIKRRMCPPGWLRALPEKIAQDCRWDSLPLPAWLPGASVGSGRGGKGELAGVGRKGSHLPACWLAHQVGGDREGRRRGSGGRWCFLSTYYVPGLVLSSGPGGERGGRARALELAVGRGCWRLPTRRPSSHPVHLCPQLRGTAGGLFDVHEWLQPGVLEGCGREGLLPWLLGVPVLWYGVGAPALFLAPHPWAPSP